MKKASRLREAFKTSWTVSAVPLSSRAHARRLKQRETEGKEVAPHL